MSERATGRGRQQRRGAFQKHAGGQALLRVERANAALLHIASRQPLRSTHAARVVFVAGWTQCECCTTERIGTTVAHLKKRRALLLWAVNHLHSDMYISNQTALAVRADCSNRLAAAAATAAHLAWLPLIGGRCRASVVWRVANCGDASCAGMCSACKQLSYIG